MAISNGIGIGIKSSAKKKTVSFNDALVDAWFMSGISNSDKPQYIKGINETSFYPADFNVIYGTKENITPTTITLDAKNGYVLNDGTIEEGSTYTTPAYTVEVKGNVNNVWIGIGYEDLGGQRYLKEIFEDGVYNIPSHIFDYNENMPVWVTAIQTGLEREDDGTVTITLRPTVRTKDLVLNNFAFTNESGFDGTGNLIFDGIDDIAIINNTDFIVNTIIFGGNIIRKETLGWQYVYDALNSRTYLTINPSNNLEAGYSLINCTENSNDIIINYNSRRITSNFRLGYSSNSSNYSKLKVRYFAIYDKTLTIDEIEAEKVKLEKEWNKRLTS